MTIPVIRKRAKRPKTRTGCRTCRQRHIKCDEERPECRRCRQSGRECAGYDVTKAEACKSQAVLLPKGSQPGSVSIPTLYPVCRSPAVATSGMSTAEQYAFDFFRLSTVKSLPGCAWSLSWNKIALQMGHHEPAVTHAAIALGSIHRALTFESFRGPAGIDAGHHQFALNQYNKAMGYLRKYIEALEQGASDSDVEVVLLVSLLFFCFEVLHNEDARATMHLRTGLRILYERVKRNNPPAPTDENGDMKRIVTMHVTPKTNMDIILQTFVRLDGDLTIVGEDEPYLFPVCYEPLPTCFYTLEEALVHLDAIGSKTHDFCRDIVVLADKEVIAKRPDVEALDDDLRNCLACAASRTIDLDSRPDIIVRMQDIRHDLNTWMTALASVDTSGQNQAAYFLTQIHFFYIWFVVATWRDETEMLVDRFDEQFAHVLSMAEQYVDLHWEVTASRHTRSNVTQSSASCTRQAFTLGTDLVPCIAVIAFKSRTTSIRRRCVELLRSINLQGVFDSYFLAAFCTLIWNLEEKRARSITGIPEGVDLESRQVPEEARFIEIELSPMHYKQDFYKADVGRLVYAIYDANGELEAHEELFRVERPSGVQGEVCKRDDPDIKMFWQIDTAAISRWASKPALSCCDDQGLKFAQELPFGAPVGT